MKRALLLVLFWLMQPSAAFGGPIQYEYTPPDFSSGGTVSGDINLSGNRLTLDADLDTYWIAPSDDLVRLYVGGTPTVYWDISGAYFLSDFRLGWASRSLMRSPVDGYILLINNAGTDFTGIQLGCTTAACPMIKKSGAQIWFRSGDDSAYADIVARVIYGDAIGIGKLTYPSWQMTATEPEGSVTAGIGSIFSVSTGGYGKTFWQKVSGTGNTGWKPIGDGMIENDAPAEPYACDATTAGPQRWYINDTDDGAPAEVCVCHGITDDSTYDWVRATDETTACTFF